MPEPRPEHPSGVALSDIVRSTGDVPARVKEPSPPLASLAFREPPPDAAAPPAAEAPALRPTFPDYAGHPDDDVLVDVPIHGLERLDYYYGQLSLTDLEVTGAITRASHWGDSVLGGDGMTDAIRQLLQARFGDAGHGFHALNRYHLGYRHRGVRQRDGKSWSSCLIIRKCRPEQRYGYAGVSTWSSGGGLSVFQTSEQGFGDKVSRFELWYARHPEGGRFEIQVDGRVAAVVDTKDAVVSDAVETVNVEDGPHEFRVRAAGGGVARGYGVVLERDVPGVVWDELSLIGSFTQRLDHQDAAHIASQVARRDVDLLVFILGGNDVQRGVTDLKTDTAKYEREYTRVLRKFRAGKPEVSCLIMSPIDHGERYAGRIRSRPIMARLVAAQRKVADAEGCAFYDTFTAMGGEGSIGRWFQARPQLAAKDLIHPSVSGQRKIATWLYHALMQGYAAYRRAQTGQPLPELGVAPGAAQPLEPASQPAAGAEVPSSMSGAAQKPAPSVAGPDAGTTEQGD